MPTEQPYKKDKSTGSHVENEEYHKYEFSVSLRGKNTNITFWQKDAKSAIAECHLYLQVISDLEKAEYCIKQFKGRGVRYTETLSNPSFWLIGIPMECGYIHKEIVKEIKKVICGGYGIYAENFWRILYFVNFTTKQWESFEEALKLNEKNLFDKVGKPDPSSTKTKFYFQYPL